VVMGVLANGGPLDEFTLSSTGGSDFNQGEKAAAITLLVVLALVILSLGAFHLHLAYRQHRLVLLLAGYLVFAVWAAVVSVALAPAYRVHVHHYIFASLLLPMTAFDHPISAMSQGALVGAAVQGIAEYSAPDMWVFVPKPLF